MVNEVADARTSVVIATRDRCDELLHTIGRLRSLPERPSIIVVDNASTDGTPQRVVDAFPGVEVVALPENRGAPARNIGVEMSATRFVAFADDDSWWAPGALRRAADHLEASPRLAVLQARILVGPEDRLDPMCDAMARSPLPRAEEMPGPSLLGFIACGAVVDRDAFLAVGGFDDLLFFLGEEQLLAYDLWARGWGLAYVDDVVAHHHPSPARDREARRRLAARNDLLVAWMRRSWTTAMSRTARAVASSVTDGGMRGAVMETAVRLPEALRRRRRLPADVLRQLEVLDAVAGPLA